MLNLKNHKIQVMNQMISEYEMSIQDILKPLF